MQKAAEQNISEQDTSEFVLNMMLAKDGPVMEMLSPFLSEQLGLEGFTRCTTRWYITWR
jgi:hypothetical protein